jgi:hypothetical protein
VVSPVSPTVENKQD